MNYDPFGSFDPESHRWSIRYKWLSVLFIGTGIILFIKKELTLGFISWAIGQIVGYISMKMHVRSHNQ